jgi:hypothetical protein
MVYKSYSKPSTGFKQLLYTAFYFYDEFYKNVRAMIPKSLIQSGSK